jgi:hypothetical protein
MPEVGPDHMELVLTLIQAVSKPDAPSNIEVGANSRHEMPRT